MYHGLLVYQGNGTCTISYNMLSDGMEVPGCADRLQFPLLVFCQLSKNLGVTALGVKELLLLTLEPFVRAAGKMDSEAVPGYVKGIALLSG